MLGSKIKLRVEALNKKEVDVVSDNDRGALDRLKSVIAKLKENVQLIADGEIKVSCDKESNVRIAGTCDIFPRGCYEKDTHSTYPHIDFFDFYQRSGYHKTQSDFKNWLNANGIKTVIIKFAYDGGGVKAWNVYYAILD